MPAEIDISGINQKELRPLIEKLKGMVVESDTVKDAFKEYKTSLDEIDVIPVCFAKLPVSARTDHGVIYLNIELLDNVKSEEDLEKEVAHYLFHECTHYLQQTHGDKPTQSSDADDYLDNPVEVEAFKNQSEFLSETQGDHIAEKYIDKVLDHHDMDGKKRKKKKNELLELAMSFGLDIEKNG
jgi:hypothetical protein